MSMRGLENLWRSLHNAIVKQFSFNLEEAQDPASRVADEAVIQYVDYHRFSLFFFHSDFVIKCCSSAESEPLTSIENLLVSLDNSHLICKASKPFIFLFTMPRCVFVLLLWWRCHLQPTHRASFKRIPHCFHNQHHPQTFPISIHAVHWDTVI